MRQRPSQRVSYPHPRCPGQRIRWALIEALRLYPEPPILIRRALEEDVLPQVVMMMMMMMVMMMMMMMMMADRVMYVIGHWPVHPHG
jgi:hypothetical protein